MSAITVSEAAALLGISRRMMSVAKERERASVLYDMLLNRPALNAGLESEYAAWTSKCYQATGAYKAAIRAGAPPDTQNARRKTSAGA